MESPAGLSDNAPVDSPSDAEPWRNPRRLSHPRMNRVTLLVSARDPAAAFQLAAFCKAARGDPRFRLVVAAQQPALDLLRAHGVESRALPFVYARDPDGAEAHALLALADEVLADARPDVVLCGLSSPGEGGIDEALLARRQVPAFVMQDFWGEQNDFFGRGPDAVFVLDEVAARLSRARHGTPAVVSGSPRHGEYRRIDIAGTRRAVRERFGIAPGAAVVGLFGQHLHDRPGYRRTLAAWAEAGLALPRGTRFLYRPHPRELPEERAQTRSWLQDAGLEAGILEAESTEESLVACDAACTVFSNCAYDAAYLNYFSASPLVTPMMLLFDGEMASLYASLAHLDDLPYLSQGLVAAVRDRAALGSALREAIGEPGKARTWRAARSSLPDPSLAASRMADALLASAGGRLPATERA